MIYWLIEVMKSFPKLINSYKITVKANN